MSKKYDDVILELAIELDTYHTRGEFYTSDANCQNLMNEYFSLVEIMPYEEEIIARNKINGMITRYKNEFMVIGILYCVNNIVLINSDGSPNTVEYFYTLDGYDAEKEFLHEFEKYLETSKDGLRLENIDSDHIELAIEKRKALVSYGIELLAYKFNLLNEESDYSNILAMQIIFISILGKEFLPNTYVFSFIYSLCQYLNRNANTQLARDYAETAYKYASQNKKTYLGAIIQSSVFTLQQNTTDSLFYLSYFIFLCKNKEIPSTFLISSLIVLQTITRDSIPNYEKKIFEQKINPNINLFSDRQELQVMCSHYYSMLSLHEDCSNDVAEYIYSRIESICQTGREAIQTVYLLLNNIYYAMGNDRIIFLLEYFSKIIPQEERQKIDNLLGNGLNILNTYDLIVNRLKKTKYTFDLISEIKRYSIAFRHLMEKGIKEGSIIYFLAGFRLNYDISIVSFEVKNKEINGEDAYKSIKQVEQIVCKDLMILASHCDVMFITNIEKKIGGYIINNSNGNSIPFVIEKSYGSLMEAVKNDDELYNFDTSKKDENGVYRFSKQDYEKIESEQCTIFSQFSIGNIVPNSRPLCVFKGIEESEFPENLLADEHGFVFLRKPIFSNVTWENNSNYSEDIIEKYKSLLWIPKETGDFTLNLLYSKIEETIKDNDIDCNVDSEIKISEDSRIVIICAHGESNIFETQRIIANNVNDGHKEEYYNIEKFLNNKDIVILFVCNSGKMKKDFLTEKINALTVSLFENGVKAVIAPKWPLHVDVVSIWFPAFFSAFKSGRSALNSFYDASKKVYEEYQHPGAWANLHYFGNPNIFIRKLE